MIKPFELTDFNIGDLAQWNGKWHIVLGYETIDSKYSGFNRRLRCLVCFNFRKSRIFHLLPGNATGKNIMKELIPGNLYRITDYKNSGRVKSYAVSSVGLSLAANEAVIWDRFMEIGDIFICCSYDGYNQTATYIFKGEIVFDHPSNSFLSCLELVS